MDRSLESKAFARAFAAGLLALALSVGGQVATGRGAAGCPLDGGDSVAAAVIASLRPAVRAHGGVAQRVALAVLGAVLGGSCS